MLRKKSLTSRYRKGNAVLDTIFFLVVLFVLIISILVASYFLNESNADIQADSEMSNVTKTMMAEQTARFDSFFDGAFVFFFIGLWIVVLVASYQIDAHPLFFGVTLVLFIFVFFIGAAIGNSYEELTADDVFSEVAPNYPMANWFMTHLLIVAVVVAFSIAFVLFAKGSYG